MQHRFEIAGLPTQSWKNGGGTTREIVCVPAGAGMDAFDWRVSIATIAKAGPFSTFPGIDRTLMLLGGDGIQLRMAGGQEHRLERPEQSIAFSGEDAVDCTLLGLESTDFNVMTRRGVLKATLQVLDRHAALPPAHSGVLLCLQGGWERLENGSQVVLASGTGLWWNTPVSDVYVTPRQHNARLLWVQITPWTD